MGPGNSPRHWTQIPVVSAALTLREDPPPRRTDHEAMWHALEVRERLGREHPEVLIESRRLDDGSLIFEVSEPGRVGTAWQDPVALLSHLEKTYLA